MADVVRIRLLGGFEVRAGNRAVSADAWRLRKATTLIKLLALEPSHQLHRDRIIAHLWPEQAVEPGRNNLNQVLHAARRALATVDLPASTLALRHDIVVLSAEGGVTTDLEELFDAAASARGSDDGAQLAAVLERWPGDLLPDDTYEPWAREHIVAYRERRTQLVTDAAAGYLAIGRPDNAVSLLTSVTAAEPLHEPAHRSLMRALAEAGRRVEALMVFERLRDVLDRELAAEPEPETRRLYRQLLAGAVDRREPGPGSISQPVNLPAPMTTLIGRTRELQESAAMLDRTRLLTLTGAGGAGKTAMAIELARRAAPRFRDGAFLVDLALLADGSLVPQEVARALHLQLPARPTAQSLVAGLRSRQVLVLLDNCEHLIDACAHLVTELLRWCPEVTVLATSREPLHVEGEITYRMPSLALPDPAALPPLGALAEIASVQLFAQRASEVSPTFALTETNAAAVAEICYRLDGMPLALELAAACTAFLSPPEIAARLGEALTLLRRGTRGAITRQQTLEATLAWSHDLLGDDERVLFRRLAVFAGSFPIDAVDGVAGQDLGARAVFTSLGRLVDTSLVVVERRDEVTRYRLLETVRQFAHEQLEASGEAAAVHERHCAWYVGFAEARDPERSIRAVNWLPAQLDVEHDNIRSALSWALRNHPDSALRLTVALWRYWLVRGLLAEGSRWLEAVLTAVPEPSVLRARAMLALAVFDLRRGATHRLAGFGSGVVAIHRDDSDPALLSQAVHAEAVLAYMLGTWDRCEELTREAASIAERAGSQPALVAATSILAMLAAGRGQLAEARQVFGRVASGLHRIDPTVPPFFTPVMLGFVVEVDDNGPRVFFEETVLLGRRVGAEQAAAYVLANLAYIARLAGELDEAQQLLEQAARSFTAVGDLDGEALVHNHLGCLARTRGEYDVGRAAFERALRLRHAIGDRRATGLTLANLGVLTAAEGDIEGGCLLLRQALADFREIEDAPGIVGMTLNLAAVHAAAGAFDEVVRILPEALEASVNVAGNHRATAWAFAMLADAYDRVGDTPAAEQARREAGARFAALGAVDGTDHVQHYLYSLQTPR